MPHIFLLNEIKNNKYYVSEANRKKFIEGTVLNSEINFINQKRKTVYDNINLPKTPFAWTRLNEPIRAEWDEALVKIKKVLGANGGLFIPIDHPFMHLALYAKKRFDINFIIVIDENVGRVGTFQYLVFPNTSGFLCANEDLIADLKASYICPYEASINLKDALGWFGAGAKNQHRSNTISKVSQNKTRLLIVSYFAGGCRSVAVQRINYWLETIDQLSDGEIEPHLATAIDWDVEKKYADRVHIIADFGPANLIEPNGDYPAWGYKAIANEGHDAKSFSTMAYHWRFNLEKYFDSIDLDFDVVLISGNPYHPMDFAAFAKKKWYAKIILDYRDPFARNPGMKFNDTAREKARYRERGFNYLADMIITVNDNCTSLVDCYPDVDVKVVSNGYDDRVVQSVEREQINYDGINFVHGGSFYHYRPPNDFIRSLDAEKHRLHHVGGVGGIDQDLLNNEALTFYGRQTYQRTLGIIGGADCGLVFVSKDSFESTTKIYDYLAMGIDILICTLGELKRGPIATMLEGLDNVYWCKNEPDDIEKFLESYVPNRVGSKQKLGEQFSRKNTTLQLINLIREHS